jgi:TRAP-type C4-dicarboxylate transport system substrate-binding protein
MFLAVTKLAEIQEAILQLNPKEQQVLRHWLDETAEETPEMIAAIDEGLRSLATEGGVPIEEARRHLRQWITG